MTPPMAASFVAVISAGLTADSIGHFARRA
jgi:hypothetical protein